jgi:radical SAM protein with 4Fe4S-binding SPASM domain
MEGSSGKNSLQKMSIELTTTQACNFKCEYCFEHGCTVPDDNLLSKRIDTLVDYLKDLFLNEWYRDTYSTTQLVFWGGEPSLNIKFIERITEEFVGYNDVSFYIYTNGSQIKQLLPILDKMKDMKLLDGSPKFGVQISYDGNPVHDMRRLSKSDEKTSQIAEEAMEILKQNNIRFSLKATLAHKDFKYMPECWDDFKRLYEKFGDQISYSLTVDYHNIEIKKYFSEMERALIDVAKREWKFHKDHGRFLSNIFSSNKKFCSAGKQMLTVDVDGKMYHCHGCIYSSCSKDLHFGYLFDLPYILPIAIKANYEYFFETQRPVSECENCVALTCLRCNVKKYENSKHTKFLDRWHDYPSQDELCLYYKTAGRIGRALIEEV